MDRKASFVIIEGPGVGTSLVLTGAGALCAGSRGILVDTTPGAPGLVRMECSGGVWRLEPVSEGVQLNGHRAALGPLVHGDILQLAGCTLLFCLDAEERSSTEISSLESLSSTTSINRLLIQARAKPERISRELIRRLQTSEKHLEILYQIAGGFGLTMDPDEFLRSSLEVLFNELPADRGFLLIREKPEAELHLVHALYRTAGHRPEAGKAALYSHAVVHEVETTGDSILSSNLAGDHRFAGLESISGLQSILSSPIVVDGAVRGVILLDTVSSSFGRADLSLASGVAAQIGFVYEKLHLERIRREKDLIEKEIRHAQAVQNFLLPKQIPKVPGVAISLKYVLSGNLGGDYYDFIRLDLMRLGVLVGDVAGHSISSALVMSMCRSVLRATCRHSFDPARILTETNRIIREDISPGMFVTLFFGVLDLRDLTFTYANAGHPYPLLQDPRRSGVRELSAGGFPLGLRRRPHYANARLSIPPGSRLLLFTDGVTETKGARGNKYGKSSLERVLESCRYLHQDHILDTMYQNLLVFRHGTSFADDVTMVLFEFAPENHHLHLELPSTAGRTLEATEKVLRFARESGFAGSKENYFRLVLKELFDNALTHGNAGDPRKKIEILARADTTLMEVVVGNEGPGFDSDSMVHSLDETSTSLPRGRGLFLVKSYCGGNLRWNTTGTQIAIRFGKAQFG